jgi:methyl-accepting chemotaxis protein
LTAQPTDDVQVNNSLLHLASSPIRRIGVTTKILAVGVTLTIPLVLSVREQRSEIAAQISFAESEARGVEHLALPLELAALARQARFDAMTGATVNGDAVRAAIEALLADDRHDSAEGSTGHADLKAAVDAALASTGQSEAVMDAYGGLLDLVNSEITDTADESQLSLDPELGSYYLGVAVSSAIPQLARAADELTLATIRMAENPDDIEAWESAAIAASQIEHLQESLTLSVDTAVPELRNDLGLDLQSRARSFVANTQLLVDAYRSLERDAPTAIDRLDPAVVIDSRDAVLDQLDTELGARIDSLKSTSRVRLTRIAAFFGVALVLMGLIAWSTRRSVTSIRRSLRDLAQGRLTSPTQFGGQDEFARMERDLAAAVDHTRSAIGDMSVASRALRGSVSSVGQLSTELSERSTTTAAQATEVASATEQLAAAIHEISTAASTATSVAYNAKAISEEATVAIEALDRRSAEIGDVVRTITEIAEQTNLLALNATIEAARAGAAGRGFAVVADEVKSLANETAKATEAIAVAIGQVQSDTGMAVAAISRIAQVIDEVNGSQATISAAVEEQAVTTRSITEIVGGFAQAAAATGAGAATLATVARSLEGSSEQLASGTDRYALDQS